MPNLKSLGLYAVEHLTTIAFGLLGTAYVARVFGPESLGRLSQVQSVANMVLFMATLGLDHFIVRELCVNRADRQLIGTVSLAQVAGWGIHSLLVFAALAGSHAHPGDFLIVVSVVLTTYLTRTIFLRLYFQAISAPKVIAVSAVVSRALALIYLLWSVAHGASYEIVLIYLPLQAAVQGAMFAWAYLREQPGIAGYDFSLQRLRKLLAEAWPVLLSTALFPLFTQSDVLLVAHFRSIHEVGVYSAAMRLVVQLNFVGQIITMTFFPLLTRYWNEAPERYHHQVRRVATVLTVVSLTIAAGSSLLAGPIVELLYGPRFSESAEVLRIGAWVWVFLLPGTLYSRLLVLHGLARYELVKSIVAAVGSIGLNVLLIPHFGVVAAATVAVIAYLIADLLMYAAFAETRPIFRIALASIALPLRRPCATMRELGTLFGARA